MVIHSFLRTIALAFVGFLVCVNAATVPIIFDTDMESDVDDVGALAMAHALADKGEANFLGVMVCAKNNWSTLCADRINTYFKRGNLPLGQLKGPGVNRSSKYAQQVAEEFPGPLASASNAPDAVKAYRAILAARPDKSVVILTVGYLTNLRDLLASGADEHSSLDGRALVQKKVKIWVCMGGQFLSGYEANIRWDATASIVAIRDWPTDIIFAGWEAGLMDTGGKILDLPTSSPVRRAYQLFGRIPHKSWDQVATLYAVRGLDNGPSAHHWKLSDPGRIVISSDGSNTWQNDPNGRHRYLIQQSTNSVIAQEMDALMMHVPATGGNQAPTVALNSPTPGASYTTPATITVSANAADADGSIAKVEFFAGASKIGEDTSAPYSVTWNNVVAGSYTLSARATDNQGASSTSAGVAVTVVSQSSGGTAYSPDAHTLVLYHFDETSGTIGNHGSAGSALNLTNTGGANGRGGGGGGYGASAFPGFARAFNILNSGDGTYSSTSSSLTGGLLTAGPVPQSMLQGTDGAFTYEALINLPEIQREQQILARDGASRGMLFRVTQGAVNLYTGSVERTASIPTAGAHAFAPGVWYHVAITYTGQDGAFGNLRYYWTRVESGASQANLIGSATINDLDPQASSGNVFGIGTTTRSPFRFQAHLIDEVRISSIARSASQFIFPLQTATTNPSSIAINFQPASAQVPQGYLPDSGAIFGNRGNGHSYGWNAATNENRDRNAHADQRYDTLNHMQKPSNPNAVWEIAVPNGMYRVEILCGDPSYSDQVNDLLIEGQLVQDPDGMDNFDAYSVVVEVTDGRLTIRPAASASNAKISYLIISASGIAN